MQYVTHAVKSYRINYRVTAVSLRYAGQVINEPKEDKSNGNERLEPHELWTVVSVNWSTKMVPKRPPVGKLADCETRWYPQRGPGRDGLVLSGMLWGFTDVSVE